MSHRELGLTRLLGVVAAAALCGCAKVGSPSGGPVDKTPPRVLWQQPAADATEVPLDAHVELRFSEPMDEQATRAAVFVTPAVGAQVRCHGPRVEVALKLVPDRTYVVTVGTDARDRRGNRLEQSHTLAFATGPRLNQGRVLGVVWRDLGPAAAAHVWAWDLAAAPVVGRDPPDYRTQSGQDGTYAFARLAAGSYRVLAFADEDRTRGPSVADWLGLPGGDLVVTEADTTRAGDLVLVPPAQVPVALERLRAMDRQRLALEFSAPVSAAQVELEVEGLAVLELYGAPAEARRVYARTAVQQAGRRYAVTRLSVGGTAVPWQEPFRSSDSADRTAPRVALQRPAGAQMDAGDTLAVVFDEAMVQQAPADPWVAAPAGAAPPPGSWQWHGPLELRFVPDAPLAPGPWRWGLRLTGLTDLAGLAPADTVCWLEHDVVAAAQLAVIEGQVLADADSVWVTAQSPTRRFTVLAQDGGAFRLAGVLPGRYTLQAFADRDGDGVRAAGCLDPYAPAEPYCRWPDPIDLAAGDRAVVGPRRFW